MPWRHPRLACRFAPSVKSRVKHAQIISPPLRSSSTLTPSNTAAPPSPTRRSPLQKHAHLLTHPTTPNSPVHLAGLIRSIRKQKKVAFAHVSDGTTLAPIQAVLSPEQAESIQNGSYVELYGNWSDSPGSGQAKELHVKDILNLSPGEPETSPVQKKSQENDYLRAIPHLRMRTPLYSLLTRVRSQLVQSVYAYHAGLEDLEMVFVQTPLITSSDCEGAGEVFTITPKVARTTQPSPDGKPARVEEYFGDSKYLTVSGQLHLEAYAAELGDVWTLSPTFRAEQSDTSRHLAEFYMLETEYRSVDTLEELMDRAEDLVRSLVASLATHRTGRELLEYYADPKYKKEQDGRMINLEQRWNAVEEPFTRVTYDNAWAELIRADEQDGSLFAFKPVYDKGLQLEHERWIVENLGANRPVFVTHYPQRIKPFYMLPSSIVGYRGDGKSADSTEYAACFDLLMPYGTCELVGGSLREHDLARLIAQMRQHNLLKRTDQDVSDQYTGLKEGEDLGSLRWYADLRKYGTSPHGGFGLGFDRLLGYITGMGNVKDVVGFPRWWGRADC